MHLMQNGKARVELLENGDGHVAFASCNFRPKRSTRRARTPRTFSRSASRAEVGASVPLVNKQWKHKIRPQVKNTIRRMKDMRNSAAHAESLEIVIVSCRTKAHAHLAGCTRLFDWWCVLRVANIVGLAKPSPNRTRHIQLCA